MIPFLPDDRPYIIAEVGGNHGGDYETALEYVEAAAKAGVDAVKFQIYRAERLIQRDEPSLPLAGDEYDTQYDRFKELELTTKEWDGIVETVGDHDLDFTASVFHPERVGYVAEVSPLVKIASGDLTNVPLLRKAADLDKPIVMSTGFATMEEIKRAVAEIPTSRLVLLHCMGAYPTDDADANLQMIDHLREQFDVPIGYSDHTIGNLACTVAMAKDAAVIEKHFTLDKSLEIGDHQLSANPDEMAELVEFAGRIGQMTGNGDRSTVFECETKIKHQMRRSLAVKTDVAVGETLEEDTVIALRPEGGISPFRYDNVVGTRAKRDLDAGSLLTEEDFG